MPNETHPLGGNFINTTTCHGFNGHTQTWETFHDLNFIRQGASSVLLPCDGSLMIAGGSIEPEIEILDMHHGWKIGAPMPESRILGCMLTINNCEVAYIGGANSTANSTNTILIYNCETKEWRQAAETLSTPRVYHQCVLLKNPMGDRPTVVVFGGTENPNTVSSPPILDDTVEFWDLETHQITQPSDPKFLSSLSTIGMYNIFILY